MPTPTVLSKPQPGDACPCGSGAPFSACCGPIVSGERTAATAEQLMRSRFTAHVVEDDAYLHRTYLPTAKKPFVEEPEMQRIGWTRLTVHSHEAGPGPDTASVEFSAFYLGENDNELFIQEKSEFKRVEGQWYYTRLLRSGPAPIKSAGPKVGRNDPCPCGSGKKFKHCCLGKA